MLIWGLIFIGLCIQTMKNALAAFGLGGAGGGSDFDPKGKTENEVTFF